MITKNNSTKPVATPEIKKEYDELQAKYRQAVENDIESGQSYIEKMSDLENKYNWFGIVFEENGKKGVKDVGGTILVPAIYDDIAFTYDYCYFRGLPIAVVKDGKLGLVTSDGKGTPLSEFDFDTISMMECHSYYILGKSEEKKCKVVDHKGNTVVDFGADKVYDDTQSVIYEQDGKFGMVSLTFGMHIPPIYDEIIDEGQDSLYTFVKDGVSGYLTEENVFVTKEHLESLNDDEYDDLYDTLLYHYDDSYLD